MYNVHVLVHCKYSDTKGHSCLPNVHNLPVLFDIKLYTIKSSHHNFMDIHV